MAQQPEPYKFGATIVTKEHNGIHAPVDMSPLTPAITNKSVSPSYFDDEKPIPPCSPFYQHPPASHERVPQAQHHRYPSTKSIFDDIGAMEKGFLSSEPITPYSVQDKNPFCSTVSVNTNKECTMWPSKQTLQAEKLNERKRKRSARTCGICAGAWHSWEKLHKDHRLAVRMILALFLIGAMIGLGVGISKAVHGSYYSGSGASMST